jgi:hypothetical protein
MSIAFDAGLLYLGPFALPRARWPFRRAPEA